MRHPRPGSTAFPAGYEACIEQFFQDVGGTPFYNVVTQYDDTSGAPVPNAASFGGAWTDTNAFGNAGTLADPVTDGDIQQAVNDAISANSSWQAPGLSTMYSLTPQSHGTSVSVNIHDKSLPLVPVATSCVAGQQEQYENQNLPATDTTDQRGSYYELSVSAGGKSTSLRFTLAPTQFAELVVTVK